MYQDLNKESEKKIQKIIEGLYETAAIGSIDSKGFPLVTKVIPMFYKGSIFLLLSDLSEHTKNIVLTNKVSIYYALEQHNELKSNNPRLTLVGNIQKVELKKDDEKFEEMLHAYSKIEKGSKMWGLFKDFNFYLFKPKRLLFVEGFGKVYKRGF